MATNKNYTVPLKRKREGLTNYKKRLNLLKSGDIRLVIRRSLNNINVQFVEFNPEGDKVLASANSKELTKRFGWKAGFNTSSSYLTGLLAGLRAKGKKISKAVVDFGLQNTGSRLYAALKGVVDSGLNVKHSKEIFPSDERIKGEHIAKYAQGLDRVGYNKQFSKYMRNNIKAEEIAKHFEEVKKNITEKWQK